MTREIKFRCWDKKVEAMRDDVAVYSKGVHIFGEGWKKFEDFIPMQFTGLHDKNGKEIFEGDIVKQKMGNRELIGVMTFDETRATFGFNAEIESEHEVPEHLILKAKPEILGNVYEHPTLLTP